MATHRTSNPDTTSEHVKGELFEYCKEVKNQIAYYGYGHEKVFGRFDTNMESWFKARVPPKVAANVLMRTLGMEIPRDSHEPIWIVEKRLTSSHELEENHVWTLPIAESESRHLLGAMPDMLRRDEIDELELYTRDNLSYSFNKTNRFADWPLPREERGEKIELNPSAYSI